jgi:hypothetical protein
MKSKNRTIEPPKPVAIVIPRAEGDIILHAAAIMDFTEFETGCPVPKPPTITLLGKEPEPDLEDKDFKKQLEVYSKAKMGWTCFKSLSLANPDIEFEIVKADDANTWPLFNDEMGKSFTEGELGLIIQTVLRANGMSRSYLEEARDRFQKRAALEAKN